MKCKRIDTEGFKPVVLEITLESQEQVDTFYNLCNYNSLVEFVEDRGLDLRSIRDSMCGMVTPGSWNDFYRDLCRALEITK